MKIRTSLRFKINGAIIIASVTTAIVFGSILFPFEMNRRKAKLDQVNLLLNVVFNQKNDEIANEIFAQQKEALANSLKTIEEVNGIKDVYIYDLEGEFLMSANNFFYTSGLTPAELEELTAGNLFIESDYSGVPYALYYAAVEAIGERIGYIKIFYDLSDIKHDSFLNVLFFFSLLISILVIMFLLLNLLLFQTVIKPATELRNAISDVHEGVLGMQVELKSKDEIGSISSAFNAMSTQLYEQRIELLKAIRDKDTYALKLEKSNKELEMLNTGLEYLVENRTIELTEINKQLLTEIREKERADKEKKSLEEKLARSQKMEAIGLLAGGVAHDLNNVLSGIVSYPDLLLMKLPEDSPLRKSVQTIKESGEKAAAIVQDLLTLARRGVTDTTVLNMNADIIRSYLNSPEHESLMTQYPKIGIKTLLDPNLLNIKGSAVHLKKTIMNLISNAVEAQPKGGDIIISTKNQYIDYPIKGYDNVREGDFVVITIKDRGIGIAEDDLKRIFEPFYTKKVMGRRSGTGLGMAVVWGTVQDHRGYIDVSSVENDGATFELYFPVTRKQKQDQKVVTPFKEIKGNSELVLVVDDIKEQREIASEMLEKLDYRVASVSSGEEAVEYIKNKSVDILLLDMIMEPAMDGLDTYREIIKYHPKQKAVIASGFAENERVKQAQKLGAGQYIKKPYTLVNLAEAVKLELKRK